MKNHSRNPSFQCYVCGQWKRLHGKDSQGHAIQRFYSCCGENGEYEHIEQVCTDCCPDKCPYNKEKTSVMTKDELSLILFLEACAADYGGRVDTKRMNAEDRAIAKRWKESGFIEFGRIRLSDVNSQGDHWVYLTPEAIEVAHAERKARATRMWETRKYLKTTEK